MAAQALLFDLDGTLADTHPWYAEALAACCGHSAEDLCGRIRAGEAAISVARRLGVERSFLKKCRSAAGRLPTYEGVRDGLETLRRRGTPLGLVTSLSPAVLRALLDGSGLRRYFAGIVAAEQRIPKKPHPAPLLRGLERIGLKPSEAIYYVGDHLNDERSARSAGVAFAWASYGYRDAPPVAPDVVLQRFLDVLEL